MGPIPVIKLLRPDKPFLHLPPPLAQEDEQMGLIDGGPQSKSLYFSLYIYTVLIYIY